jgi:hypothetical protein
VLGAPLYKNATESLDTYARQPYSVIQQQYGFGHPVRNIVKHLGHVHGKPIKPSCACYRALASSNIVTMYFWPVPSSIYYLVVSGQKKNVILELSKSRRYNFIHLIFFHKSKRVA